VIGGVIAALFGTIDWVAIPQKTRAKTIGLWHGGGNLIVTTMFVASWLLRRPTPADPPAGAMILSATAGQTQQPPTPPLVKQINNGNWLAQNEAETLRDELFYQRAVHAYMTMLPALNTIGMRNGSEATFGKGYNVLPIWKDRMDSRTWVPTPNADVIYSMSYLDLKETGPLVIAAPANVIGMFTDFFQRTITDVGLIGPDRARGGLYLLLPPDYDGQVPQGYFAFKSSTYNVFLFFRTIMPKGDNGPDSKPAVAAAEQTRVYPLWTPEKDVKPMFFPNGSGKRVDMMYPVDNSYWTKLKQFVDYEPVAAIDPELRGVLASIGIVKGQPFNISEITAAMVLWKQAEMRLANFSIAMSRAIPSIVGRMSIRIGSASSIENS